MAKKQKKFDREELEYFLEQIAVYWHRHGSEEGYALEQYIQSLYDNLPAELREPSPEQAAKETIKVSLEEIHRLFSEALSPVFSEEDVAEEVKEFRRLLLGQGVRDEDGSLIVVRGTFLNVFDVRFSGETLTDELFDRMATVRQRFAGWYPVVNTGAKASQSWPANSL